MEESKRPARGWPFEDGAKELGGFGLGDDGLDAGVEAALVAAGGVLVEDALLDALVEDGDGGAVGLDEGFLVAGGEGLAHEAEGAAKLGFVGAVDGGLGDGLTGALERGNVICHGARSLFFSGWTLFRRKGGCWRRLVLNLKRSAAVPLQARFYWICGRGVNAGAVLQGAAHAIVSARPTPNARDEDAEDSDENTQDRNVKKIDCCDESD